MPLDQPGTYVLILHLPHRATIDVGRLGRFQFPAGWYAYAGSAHGPGGLAARIARHLRSPKPLHWHVDYLRTKAQPDQVWYAVGTQKRECTWAEAVTLASGFCALAWKVSAACCRRSSIR